MKRTEPEVIPPKTKHQAVLTAYNLKRNDVVMLSQLSVGDVFYFPKDPVTAYQVVTILNGTHRIVKRGINAINHKKPAEQNQDVVFLRHLNPNEEI